MSSPDSISPASRSKQLVAADWTSDLVMQDTIGGMARVWRIPLAATAGTLVFEDGEGNEETFNVSPGDQWVGHLARIDSASTVTHVWVGR